MAKLHVFNKAKDNQNFKLAPALCAAALTMALVPGCVANKEKDIPELSFLYPTETNLSDTFNPTDWDFTNNDDYDNVLINDNHMTITVPYETFCENLKCEGSIVTFKEGVYTMSLSKRDISAALNKFESAKPIADSLKFVFKFTGILLSTGAAVTLFVYANKKVEKRKKTMKKSL